MKTEDKLDMRYTQNGHDDDPDYAVFDSPDDINKKIDSQLDAVKVYSTSSIKAVEDYYNALAKMRDVASGQIIADKDSVKSHTDLEDLRNSPIGNIFRDQLYGMYRFVPKIADRPKFEQTFDKVLNYTPFDLKGKTVELENAYNAVKDNTQLKSARQKLFDKAACSVRTMPKKLSDKIQHELTHEKFDYEDGEKTTGGFEVHRKAFNTRKVLFNTPVFEIRNTIQWEKRYSESKQKMIDNGADPSAYKDIEGYHGCPYWSMVNIIGRNQGWFMGESQGRSGTMLGGGGYFGTKFGKCWVYVGDEPYACIDPGSLEGNDKSNGMYIVADIMLGDNTLKVGGSGYKYHNSPGSKGDMEYTSVSMDMGTPYPWNPSKKLNDYEVAIKRNENIRPKYFMDTSCRKIYENMAIDKDGNIYEWNKSYEKVCRAQKDYLERKKEGKLKPGEKYPEWDGLGYTPKWDKNGKRIGMEELD